jgi:hypothetical protein
MCLSLFVNNYDTATSLTFCLDERVDYNSSQLDVYLPNVPWASDIWKLKHLRHLANGHHVPLEMFDNGAATQVTLDSPCHAFLLYLLLY